MESPCPRQVSPRSGSRGKSIQNRADPGSCTSISPGSGCSPGWHPRSPGTQYDGKFLLPGTPRSAFSSRVLGAPVPVGSGSHRLRGWWEDEHGREDGSRTKDGGGGRGETLACLDHSKCSSLFFLSFLRGIFFPLGGSASAPSRYAPSRYATCRCTRTHTHTHTPTHTHTHTHTHPHTHTQSD